MTNIQNLSAEEKLSADELLRHKIDERIKKVSGERLKILYSFIVGFTDDDD